MIAVYGRSKCVARSNVVFAGAAAGAAARKVSLLIACTQKVYLPHTTFITILCSLSLPWYIGVTAILYLRRCATVSRFWAGFEPMARIYAGHTAQNNLAKFIIWRPAGPAMPGMREMFCLLFFVFCFCVFSVSDKLFEASYVHSGSFKFMQVRGAICRWWIRCLVVFCFFCRRDKILAWDLFPVRFVLGFLPLMHIKLPFHTCFFWQWVYSDCSRTPLSSIYIVDGPGENVQKWGYAVCVILSLIGSDTFHFSGRPRGWKAVERCWGYVHRNTNDCGRNFGEISWQPIYGVLDVVYVTFVFSSFVVALLLQRTWAVECTIRCVFHPIFPVILFHRESIGFLWERTS